MIFYDTICFRQNTRTNIYPCIRWQNYRRPATIVYNMDISVAAVEQCMTNMMDSYMNNTDELALHTKLYCNKHTSKPPIVQYNPRNVLSR